MNSDKQPLEAIRNRDIIDVRSEAEFALDHVPGAVNLPVLNNLERAKIGTLYTRVSRFDARREGAALVAKNIARYLETHLAEKPTDFAPLVYCWRGGMRSGAMAHVLRQVGWQAETLEGGYRSYRRAIVSELYDITLGFRLVMLSGHTGCAKTELLSRVSDLGLQVIDLEALARHRGSIFGADTQEDQPSQKMFESNLANVLASIDPSRPVLIECESGRIGKIRLPPSLWMAMSQSAEIALTATPIARASYLCRAYSDIIEDKDYLLEILEKLVPAQGRERVQRWKDLAEQGAFEDLAAELIQLQYDPGYTRSMARRDVETLATIDLGAMQDADLEKAALEIALIADSKALSAAMV